MFRTLLVSAALLVTYSVNAAIAVDQYQPNGGAATPFDPYAGQSFTAGIGGVLAEVAVTTNGEIGGGAQGAEKIGFVPVEE